MDEWQLKFDAKIKMILQLMEQRYGVRNSDHVESISKAKFEVSSSASSPKIAKDDRCDLYETINRSPAVSCLEIQPSVPTTSRPENSSSRAPTEIGVMPRPKVFSFDSFGKSTENENFDSYKAITRESPALNHQKISKSVQAELSSLDTKLLKENVDENANHNKISLKILPEMLVSDSSFECLAGTTAGREIEDKPEVLPYVSFLKIDENESRPPRRPPEVYTSSSQCLTEGLVSLAEGHCKEAGGMVRKATERINSVGKVTESCLYKSINADDTFHWDPGVWLGNDRVQWMILYPNLEGKVILRGRCSLLGNTSDTFSWDPGEDSNLTVTLTRCARNHADDCFSVSIIEAESYQWDPGDNSDPSLVGCVIFTCLCCCSHQLMSQNVTIEGTGFWESWICRLL